MFQWSGLDLDLAHERHAKAVASGVERVPQCLQFITHARTQFGQDMQTLKADSGGQRTILLVGRAFSSVMMHVRPLSRPSTGQVLQYNRSKRRALQQCRSRSSRAEHGPGGDAILGENLARYEQ